MKMTIQKTALILFLMALSNHIKAQSPVQNGGSDYNGDLWHLQNIGVGSDVTPDARVHIFNGKSSFPSSEPIITYGWGSRPFLITGTIDQNLTIPSKPLNFVVTVDKFGYLGVDALNPFTKMHLHNGIFTISAGRIGEEATRWEIHGTKSAFAVKDYNLGKYRLWIRKDKGFVGIGTESPDELLEVENGNLQVNNGNVKIIDGNLEIRDGSVTNFKVGQNGAVRARRIDVDLQAIPDYVFRSDYKLMPLDDLKKIIEEKKHLPNIKSKQEYNNTGSIDLTELNLKLLEKVEELTLYVIDLQEQLNAQQAELNLLK